MTKLWHDELVLHFISAILVIVRHDISLVVEIRIRENLIVAVVVIVVIIAVFVVVIVVGVVVVVI